MVIYIRPTINRSRPLLKIYIYCLRINYQSPTPPLLVFTPFFVMFARTSEGRGARVDTCASRSLFTPIDEGSRPCSLAVEERKRRRRFLQGGYVLKRVRLGRRGNFRSIPATITKRLLPRCRSGCMRAASPRRRRTCRILHVGCSSTESQTY